MTDQATTTHYGNYKPHSRAVPSYSTTAPDYTHQSNISLPGMQNWSRHSLTSLVILPFIGSARVYIALQMRPFLLLLGLGAPVLTSSPAPSSSSPDMTTTTTTPIGLIDRTRTVTVFKFPTFTNGPTLTVWDGSVTTVTETATVTSRADCHNCAHVAATTRSQGGHGPVVHHTATVTAQAPLHGTTTKTTTEVVFVCSASSAASVAIGLLLAAPTVPTEMC